jgi:hypothetical protein
MIVEERKRHGITLCIDRDTSNDAHSDVGLHWYSHFDVPPSEPIRTNNERGQSMVIVRCHISFLDSLVLSHCAICEQRLRWYTVSMIDRDCIGRYH